jgi:outer membrane protein assembly factor BamB
MNKIKTLSNRLALACLLPLISSLESKPGGSEHHALKLPDPVTSFGACRLGKYLYVYGGHMGEAHVYSKETHSKSFVRLNLEKKESEWEALPFESTRQGFGMAAHRGKVYLSGGSQATNKEDEESNLSSLDKVSVFDVKKKTWRSITPLPDPRSSHEMVAHDGKLYVIGGWHMADGKGVNWHDHGLVADLSEDPIEWKKLPKTDWVVRANSAAIVKGNLYVVGGLNDEGTTNAVRKLHLKSMKWSEVEDFPGVNRLKAFGSASVELGGNLIVSSFSYQPKIFLDSNRSWISTQAKVQDKRFFHRLVPLNQSKVLFLGGASWDGHLDGIEVLDFSPEVEIEKKNSKAGKTGSKSSNWGGFRGKGDSRSDSLNLPLGWSDESNLAWRMAIEGYGQSTPVVWGERVFSTSTEGEESERLLVHCHNLKDGELQWCKSVPTPVRIKRSQYVSQAAPSPVVDASGVFVFFESGLLMGLSHSGTELWSRSLTEEYGPMMGNHGIGGSLFQSANSLGVLVDHDGPSYLMRVDKATGENEWKTDREERVSWSTPTLSISENQETLFISSNGVVECFDFKTGKKLWYKDGVEGNTVASPSLAGGLVIVGSSKPEQTQAIRCGNEGVKGGEVSWVAEDATCSFSSPLATERFVYLVNRAGVATCHNLVDGKKLWDLRLPGSCWASPLHAPGRVYFFTKEGATVVLKDDGSTEKLSENSLSIEGKIYGLAAAENAFIMRTGSELICLREPLTP